MKTLVFLFCFISLVFTSALIASDYKISKCKTSNQCSLGYYCSAGACSDRCAMMKCMSGTICKEGSCCPKCDSKTPCQTGFYCNVNYCVDRCRSTKCAAGHYCQKGKCISVKKQCYINSDCKKGFSCSLEGSCVDSCISKKCISGTTCSAGQCIPVQKKCQKTLQCKQYQICSNGLCKDTCSMMKCQLGYTCKLGACTKVAPVCPLKTICGSARPTQKTCPIRYFFRKPDPVVCGMSSNGEYINFPVGCYACKQKDIVHWFSTPCDNIPLACKIIRMPPIVITDPIVPRLPIY